MTVSYGQFKKEYLYIQLYCSYMRMKVEMSVLSNSSMFVKSCNISMLHDVIINNKINKL